MTCLCFQEKLSLEQRLKELTDKHKEELQCVQSLLDDSSTTCDQLRHQLLEASTIEETLKKQLTGQQNDYVKEIEKLKKAIGMFQMLVSETCSTYYNYYILSVK